MHCSVSKSGFLIARYDSKIDLLILPFLTLSVLFAMFRGKQVWLNISNAVILRPRSHFTPCYPRFPLFFPHFELSSSNFFTHYTFTVAIIETVYETKLLY